MTSYLMEIIELRDEIFAICTKIKVEELVPIALNGFSPIWEVFVQGVCAREKLSTCEKLWDIFVKEETRREIVSTRI